MLRLGFKFPVMVISRTIVGAILCHNKDLISEMSTPSCSCFCTSGTLFLLCALSAANQATFKFFILWKASKMLYSPHQRLRFTHFRLWGFFFGARSLIFRFLGKFFSHLLRCLPPRKCDSLKVI